MKTILPIDIVSIGEDSNSYHLFVSGVIDGRKCDLLIDTGASHTIFDAMLIPEAPVGETAQEIHSAGVHAGELKSSFGRIRNFELGDLKRVNWTVILIDLTHVNDLYKKFTDKCAAGLIGSDFLLKHQAIIDYKKRELILRNIKQKEEAQ